jgi:nitrous oxidase accessory protein NosD
MQRRRMLAGLLALPELRIRRASAAGLVPTGALRSSSDNQVIENLDIMAPSGDALTVSHRGVVVRNCRIHHATGHGVHALESAGLVLQDLEVIRSVPRTADTECNNINLYQCPGSRLTNVRASSGSSNIYIDHSRDCRIRSVELHDARGPEPRGQNVQFSQSPRCILEDFSGENGPTSWTEDNVSVFCSNQCTVRRGLVCYNNSPTGDGVMLEGSFDCLVQDVDAVQQGNGAFAAVPVEDTGSGGCVFLRCRTRASYNAPRDGRLAPESGGLSFYMLTSPGARKHTIVDCHYDHLANRHNLIWDGRSVSEGWSLTPVAFRARDPIRLKFAWS